MRRKTYKGAAAFIQAAQILEKGTITSYACVAIGRAVGKSESPEERFFDRLFRPANKPKGTIWTWGNQSIYAGYGSVWEDYRFERVLALLLCAAMWRSGER